MNKLRPGWKFGSFFGSPQRRSERRVFYTSDLKKKEIEGFQTLSRTPIPYSSYYPFWEHREKLKLFTANLWGFWHLESFKFLPQRGRRGTQSCENCSLKFNLKCCSRTQAKTTKKRSIYPLWLWKRPVEPKSSEDQFKDWTPNLFFSEHSVVKTLCVPLRTSRLKKNHSPWGRSERRVVRITHWNST